MTSTESTQADFQDGEHIEATVTMAVAHLGHFVATDKNGRELKIDKGTFAGRQLKIGQKVLCRISMRTVVNATVKELIG